MADGSYIDVDKAIEVGKQVLAEKRNLLDRIDIVRTDLRHAVTMGSATAEQKQWVAENFPLRARRARPKGFTPAPTAK